MRRGLSIVEVVLSLVIIGTVLPAIFTLVGASATRGVIAQRDAQASWLAHDLLAEIGTKSTERDELGSLPGDTDPLATLASPPGQGGSRAAFNDVFDYNNWDSYPPVDDAGNALSGFDGWYRAARVIPINPDTLALRKNNDTAALITVTVIGPGSVTDEVSIVRTAGLEVLRDGTDDGPGHTNIDIKDVLKGLDL